MENKPTPKQLGLRVVDTKLETTFGKSEPRYMLYTHHLESNTYECWIENEDVSEKSLFDQGLHYSFVSSWTPVGGY